MPRKDNGAGSVVLRTDGRWQGSLRVNGQRKNVYGKTEKEAKRKLLELQKQVGASGSLPNPGNRTINDLLDTWLEHARTTLRPKTIAGYEQVCTYIRPAVGGIRLARLEPAHLQGFYAALGTKGTRTAARAHAVLHRALVLAVLWGWLVSNPADRVLKPAYRPKRKMMWTPDEFQRFLSGTANHPFQPLWVLILATGCRLGEALGLRWEAVDLDTKAIRINQNLQRIHGQWVQGDPKTSAGERTIALPAEAIAALLRQRAMQAEERLRQGSEWQDYGLVFTGQKGEPIGHSAVEHAIYRVCSQLGLAPLTPHGLRHLHASLLLAGGLPITAVSARLGHANVAITGSIYAHAIQGQDRQAAETIGQLMSTRVR